MNKIIAAMIFAAVTAVTGHTQQPKSYFKWKDKTGKVITCTDGDGKCFSRIMDDPNIGAVLRVYPDGRRLSYGGAANVAILDVKLTDEEILNNPEKVINQATAQETAEDPINEEKKCLRALKVGMPEKSALHCGKPTHQLHRTDGAGVLEYLFGVDGNEGFTVTIRDSHISEVQEFK